MIRLAHIIIIVFTLFALSRLILRLKDKEIRLLEFVTWFLVWLGVLAIVFMPTLITSIEQILGVKKGIDFFASAGIVLLFYLLFRIYVQTEKMEQNLTKIVRKIAIDEAHKKLEARKKQVKKKKVQ